VAVDDWHEERASARESCVAQDPRAHVEGAVSPQEDTVAKGQQKQNKSNKTKLTTKEKQKKKKEKEAAKK
jgi:hypothetical protein